MSRPSQPTTLGRLLACALGLALAAPGVLAADRETRATLSDKPSEQAAQTAGRNVRASQLIGTDVRNAQGERLGEIKDLIVDIGNDRVHYAILSFGGFLGLGDKLFAYPVKTFSQTSDGDHLVLNVDKSRLKDAPGFERDRYPDFASGRYRQEVDRYHGQTVAIKPEPGQMLRRASDLIGKNVDDRNGRNIGEIEDIIVSMANGAIPYAVLEADRAGNVTDRLVPVPLRSIDFRGDRRNLAMNIDRSQLDSLRGFDKGRWPDLNDPRHMSEVRQSIAAIPAATRGRTATQQGYTGPGEAESERDDSSMRDEWRRDESDSRSGSRTAPRSGSRGEAVD